VISHQVRVCPVCATQSSNVDSLEVKAKSPAEECQDQLLEERFIGFSNEQIFYSYARCQICQALFCPVYFSEEQLGLLYKSMPDNTAGEELSHLKRTQRGYTKLLPKSEGQSQRWLDVGADIGLLGEQIRFRNVKTSVDALEPNLDVHHELTERLGSECQIFTNWAAVEHTSYDGIAAVHVLDHLIDLGRDLDNVRDHLVTGGIFTAVVHNESSLLRKVLGRRWPPFCLQHPHLFSPVSLRLALENKGFSVESITRTTNYFTLHHIATVAFSVLGIPNRFAKFVPRLLLPLPLGNIQIVARKR